MKVKYDNKRIMMYLSSYVYIVLINKLKRPVECKFHPLYSLVCTTQIKNLELPKAVRELDQSTQM